MARVAQLHTRTLPPDTEELRLYRATMRDLMRRCNPLKLKDLHRTLALARDVPDLWRWKVLRMQASSYSAFTFPGSHEAHKIATEAMGALGRYLNLVSPVD